MDKYLKQTWYRVSRSGHWGSYHDVDKMLEDASGLKGMKIVVLSQQEQDILSAYALIMGKPVSFHRMDMPQRIHADPHTYIYPYSDNDLALLL